MAERVSVLDVCRVCLLAARSFPAFGSAMPQIDEVPRGLKANFVRPQERIFRELVEKKLASENVYVHRGNGKGCFEIKKSANARGWKFTHTSSRGQITVWR